MDVFTVLGQFTSSGTEEDFSPGLFTPQCHSSILLGDFSSKITSPRSKSLPMPSASEAPQTLFPGAHWVTCTSPHCPLSAPLPSYCGGPETLPSVLLFHLQPLSD